MVVSFGVGHCCSSDPVLLLLWLCCRSAPTPLTQPPSLETSVCRGYGPKKEKKENELLDLLES